MWSANYFSTPIRHLLVLVILFCAASASAAQLFWDAGNTNNGAVIDPGTGGWDLDTTTNIFWNAAAATT
jgi:hypothetical protein